jgi:hypothetical protein
MPEHLIGLRQQAADGPATRRGAEKSSFSRDDAGRCLIDRNTLYVLGFGLAGAIVADAVVLTLFFS